MGHCGLWCNKSFSHDRCPHDQHVPNQQTYHCLGPEWGARILQAHVHSCYPCPPHLSQHAHIIPGLASHSLISVVTLCNTGCNAVFTKIRCTIMYCGKIILCGGKCTCTGLWMTPLYPTSPLIANNHQANLLPTVIAAKVDATSCMGECARYIHQALCSPPATTLIRVLKCSRELATIPGLMGHLINTYLPYSTATDKGHMRHHTVKTFNPPKPCN